MFVSSKTNTMKIKLISCVKLCLLSAAVILSGCNNDDNSLTTRSISPSIGDQVYLGGAEENYVTLGENPFVSTNEVATSTFSIDADGGSYTNTRRFILKDKILPPSGAVRIEEFINYFDLNYDYTDPTHPININGEMSDCPWAVGHKLVRIGIKGKPIAPQELPNSNFVFLIDVSGSMNYVDKLELLKAGFKQFVNQMRPEDRVAIVTYAGADRVLLPPRLVMRKTKSSVLSTNWGPVEVRQVLLGSKLPMKLQKRILYLAEIIALSWVPMGTSMWEYLTLMI